jgi:hypothetical protein
MKNLLVLVLLFVVIYTPSAITAQDKPIRPSLVITGQYLGETPPLRDLPTVSQAEWQQMLEKAESKMLNPELESRSYPYAETALPKGPDPAWQRHMGTNAGTRATVVNFAGQDSPYFPPDCNGTIGPFHYMQTVNTTYAIYNRTGTLLAGPSNLNTLFTGLPGATYNDGDPVVLYDEQADRWLMVEFSISGSNDYMLIAVSTTNDPTGTWYKYSFDVDDTPDYEKFGIWGDGYYMGTNNSVGNDIYVFERSQILAGGTPQAVGFNNAWRPTTVDGFMCVPPLDNDGAFAPAGEPGLFITINDDAIGGGSDQLWIYELDVDWTTPANSTFTRTQQLNVAIFDSNFGSTWANIAQLGTNQKVDAIPQVIMNPPQYRNFGSYETILCCHTVDVDQTDHAGVRWYELRRVNSGNWTIRQYGTYAPDNHSRWMGSIMLNSQNEIGLGYSVSSSTIYPAIRYCGQSSAAYASANGIMDITEATIQDGVYFQSSYDRWGDYSALQVDPTDNRNFWFTSEYIGTGGTRKTKIASFSLTPVTLNANFWASNITPPPNTSVLFTDLSSGSPNSWSWSFTPATVTYLGGTSSSSQNPQVSFNSTGFYTVALTVGNGTSNDTETRTDFIKAYIPGYWNGSNSTSWNTPSNWDGSVLPTPAVNVVIPTTAVNWPAYSGDFIVGTTCNTLTFNSSTEMNITGNFTINQGESVNMTGGGLLSLTGNWLNNGSFTPGTGTVRFTGSTPVSASIDNITLGITTYTISTFTKGMTALSGATSGPTGDDGNAIVPIGFTFNYTGVNYSSLKISTNGWVSLNQTGDLGYSNGDLFTTTTPNATLTPWWDDLMDDGTSFVYYKTTGVSPNRVFTGEWNRVLTYYTGATSRISFQVKLFETTNVIEFHYGTAESGTHNGSETASIGVEDATGGSGHFKEATTGSTTVGVSNLVSSSNWPTVNYRYTPPAVITTLQFSNIVISNPGGVVNFNNDTEVSGNFNVLTSGAFKVATGKTLTVQGTAVK